MTQQSVCHPKKKKSQSGLTGEQSPLEPPCFPSPVRSQLRHVRMYLVEGLAKGKTFYFIVLLWLLNCDIMNISSINKKLRTHKIISMLNSGTGCHYLDFHSESRCGSNNSNVWTYCTLHDTRPCQPGPPSIWIWLHVFIYVTRARTHITSL